MTLITVIHWLPVEAEIRETVPGYEVRMDGRLLVRGVTPLRAWLAIGAGLVRYAWMLRKCARRKP